MAAPEPEAPGLPVNALAGRGIVLLGCGRMGSALLGGWLAGGLDPGEVHVIDPQPPEWLNTHPDIRINTALPEAPAVALIAVKPQMMDKALPALLPLTGKDTLFVSIAAGVPIARYEAMLGAGEAIVRAMPNTPAAIGRGITALAGNARAGAPALDLAEGLLRAVGDVVRLGDESLMDAVTAVSGSGPAYLFHMIEALAAAGTAEGLAPDLALRLATATMAGAGALALESGETPEALRRAVTSPGGTTEAALGVLTDDQRGLPPLMRRTVAAAAARSRELGG